MARETEEKTINRSSELPLVSIVVPVYNAEKYLTECLDCLVNQTYKNLEIICINDGSIDNSLRIIEGFAREDSRIKVFSQENQGEAVARNRGASLASGKYITALDADDVCSLNTIESSVKIAEEENKDIVINFLNTRLDLDKKRPQDFSYTSVWQILYKKELLDNNPDIYYNKDLKMGPDVIFTHKVLGITDKIAKNPNSKYYYRRHDLQISSIMAHTPDKFIENIRIWFEDLTDFYNKHDWWKSHNDHFINFLCELPFTQYMRVKWNAEQKQEIFNLIRETIKEHQLTVNFDYSNKRVEMFKRFLSCKNWKQFEPYWLISHLYFKYIDWKKAHTNWKG